MKLYSIIILFLGTSSCQNSVGVKNVKCSDYSYSKYYQEYFKILNPKIRLLNDSMTIIDERNNKKFGGVYYFDKNGKFLKYQFYLSSDRISYVDSLNIKDNFPLLSYSFYLEKNEEIHLGIMLSKLNKKILKVYISKKEDEVNNLEIRNYKMFSNVVYCKVFFKNYSLKELSKQKLYLCIEYLNCKGEKIQEGILLGV